MLSLTQSFAARCLSVSESILYPLLPRNHSPAAGRRNRCSRRRRELRLRRLPPSHGFAALTPFPVNQHRFPKPASFPKSAYPYTDFGKLGSYKPNFATQQNLQYSMHPNVIQRNLFSDKLTSVNSAIMRLQSYRPSLGKHALVLAAVALMERKPEAAGVRKPDIVKLQ